MTPVYECYANPCTVGCNLPEFYDAFELQTVQEYLSFDGVTKFFEAYHDNDMDHREHPDGHPVGEPQIGLYGHLNIGGVEHIADYATLEDAHEILRKLGVDLTKQFGD